MATKISPQSRKRRLFQSTLTTVGLSLVTLLLFVAVGYSTVTRAFNSAEFPPTATIPADLGANLAQVSDLVGNVQRRRVGADNMQPVRVGSTLAAGDGSFISISGPGYVSLSLANRAVLYLDDNSEFELKSIEGKTEGVLNVGRILLNSPQRDLAFVFSAPTGAQLNATGRTLAGINYDADNELFVIDCLRGTCDVTGGDATTLRISTGQRAEVQGSGAASMTGEAHFELYQSIGARGIVATPTRPRVTVAPTEIPATATPTQIPTTPTATPIPTIIIQPTLTPTVEVMTATIVMTPTAVATSTIVMTPTISAESTITPSVTTTVTLQPVITATAILTNSTQQPASPTLTSEPTAIAPPTITLTPDPNMTDTPIAPVETPTITPTPAG